MLALLMVINRRSKSCPESGFKRKNHAGKLPHAANKARTRTSLIGVTIYQPDVEPSARGRRLLAALESIFQDLKSRRRD
jgi:hypothetical protein